MNHNQHNTYHVLSMMVVALFLCTVSITGCSTTHKTTTRTVTTETEPTDNYSTVSASSNTTITTEQTEKERETDDAPRRGILSSTVHAIGYVIALPFILVGGLIKAIF